MSRFRPARNLADIHIKKKILYAKILEKGRRLPRKRSPRQPPAAALGNFLRKRWARQTFANAPHHHHLPKLLVPEVIEKESSAGTMPSLSRGTERVCPNEKSVLSDLPRRQFICILVPQDPLVTFRPDN